jgi:hypothetical protein
MERGFGFVVTTGGVTGFLFFLFLVFAMVTVEHMPILRFSQLMTYPTKKARQ